MNVRRCLPTPTRAALLLLLLAALGATLWGQSTPQAPQPEAIRVEVDIFSGRPNPFWELKGSDAAEFLKRFRALPRSADGSIRDGLGYRGLIVTAKAGSIDSFEAIVISSGVVLGRRSQNAQRFADSNRALERWLLTTGKPTLDPAIYNEAVKGL